VVLLGGNLGVIAASYRRSSGGARLFQEGVVLGVLMAFTELVVCALAAFLGDIARHLYIFQALFDLILIADVAWLVEIVWRRSRARSLATVPAHAATISRL